MTTTHPRYRDRDGYIWEDREGFPMLVTPNGPAPTDYVTMQGVRHAYGPLVRVEQAEPAPRADTTPGAKTNRHDRRRAHNDRRIAEARKAEAATWERRLREELEARDAERDEEIAARDARIAELELLLHGTLDRRCSIPGCTASYQADTGPAPGLAWMRSTSPPVLLCPGHAHLMTGDTSHTPRLDHPTRTAACTCGHALPGPTLGHMGAAWIGHALNLLETDRG